MAAIELFHLLPVMPPPITGIKQYCDTPFCLSVRPSVCPTPSSNKAQFRLWLLQNTKENPML